MATTCRAATNVTPYCMPMSPGIRLAANGARRGSSGCRDLERQAFHGEAAHDGAGGRRDGECAAAAGFQRCDQRRRGQPERPGGPLLRRQSHSPRRRHPGVLRRRRWRPSMAATRPWRWRHHAGDLRADHGIPPHTRKSPARSRTVENPVELDETGKAAVVATAQALGVDAGNAQAYSLGCGMELAPDPDRRLTLTGESDALGLPRLKLDMRIADDDFDRLSPHPDRTGTAACWPPAPACCASTTRAAQRLAEQRWIGAIITWAPPA